MSDQPGPSSMEVEKEPDPVENPASDNSDEPQTDQSDNLAPTGTDTDIDKKLDESSTSDSKNQRLSKSKELKMLLALSKEANLKTNISHKRKKDVRDSPRTQQSESESKKSVPKHCKFPVTAEAELEEIQENETKFNVIVKRKRNDSIETLDDVDENKKSKRAAHGEYKVFKPNKDIFCWRCHRSNVNVVCETCPRSYHRKCLKQTITDANHWPCPECVSILKAESTQSRSAAMRGMTLEHLCSLLKFAVNRMKECNGSEPFLHPVSNKDFPDYKKYIIQPMDLTMLEKNIKDNLYGSPQAFEADAKWLLHNSIIFNSYQSKLTTAVKSMIKICKQEMIEIENCPSCYLKANTKKSTWFVEVCPKPHILVWAKLKGFPYWPAKVMSVNPSGMVDVRFFGAHDRAWVHWRECYLYSEKDPNTHKQKRFDIEKCVMELNLYIDNLKKIYEEFRYAPFRTPLDPHDIHKQLAIFLPKYKSIQSRRKSSEPKPEDQIDQAQVPKEEPLDEPEKSETSSNTHSNINSPVPDNDTTMEGYGTDDDMPSEIDHEGRRAFAGTKCGDKTEDDEDDEDDTQVNSNVSAEGTPVRGAGRTRGSFVGKLKNIPRLSSDNLKSDDSSISEQKSSRRNSDQSVKSDSSRISDKINRVTISENVEITLGNEDVGCVSISENISTPNGENSRSESEHSIEIKKKPVQVDIENAELSISPTKTKISDQLIKRLSDGDQNLPKINLNGDASEEKTKSKTIQPSITEYISVKPRDVEEKKESETISITDEVTLVPSKVGGDKAENTKEEAEKANSECSAWKKVILAALLENGGKNSNEVATADLEKPVEKKAETSEKTTEEIADKVETKDAGKEVSTEGSTIQEKIVENIADVPEKIPEASKTNNSDEDSIKGAPGPEKSSSESEKSSPSPGNTKNNPLSKETPSAPTKPIVSVSNTPKPSDSKPTEEEQEEEPAVVYNKKNIFDVIHSSLKNPEPSKKRKLPPEDEPSPVKILKLVSIESILKNKDKEEKSKLDIAPEDIKSEPESEEEWDDVTQMEEKRKYLSALNIHEKTEEREKKERNEIRTRSKAEEKRERFKVVDNLTRIIDDVAMNYSAQHDGEKMPPRKPERRKSNSSLPMHEGEIFVKSFAKISSQPHGKQRARKTFPIPVYVKQAQPLKAPFPKRDVSVFKKDPPQPPQKLLNPTISSIQEKTVNSSPKTVQSSATIPPLSLISQPPAVTASSNAPSPASFAAATPLTMVTPSVAAAGTMAMGQVILVPGPAVNYCSPISTPILSTVSHPTTLIPANQFAPQTQHSVLKTLATPNVLTSQNYIPHSSEDSENSDSPTPSARNQLPMEATIDGQKSQETAETSTPSTSNTTTNAESLTNVQASNSNIPTPSVEQEDEFAILNGLVPESVSLAVSELLLRPPPRLRPRPPGITSQNFDDGIPSTAGDVTAKINSIAHRMTDYFRGMLIETLEDVGRTTSPEAKITSLQLEIESLKHRHSLEMAEMRKNMCTILKDIQRSIVEERDKIVDETRAACEEETIRRIEMAKSKQWCANCPKEAQFYCCWNTSYCDYPCQQKHWPQHAGKCTQSIEKGTVTGSAPPPPRPAGQPIVLRPALAPLKPAMGRIVAKPAKVYMNKTNSSQKSVKAIPTSGLTLVETTPGNYELVGNGSPIGLSGKIYTTAALGNKYKVTSTTAGNSSRSTDSGKQTSSSRSQQM